jgi:hypothetical protein
MWCMTAPNAIGIPSITNNGIGLAFAIVSNPCSFTNCWLIKLDVAPLSNRVVAETLVYLAH